MRYPTTLLALLSLASVAPVNAQPLSRLVGNAPDGYVRFSMAARPDVCGFEDAILILPADGKEGGVRAFHESSVDLAEARARCVQGPVRVELAVRGRKVQQVSTRVGADFARGDDPVTDLGSVSAREGVEYLLALAPTVAAAHGDDPLAAVALADGANPSAELLQLAANRRALTTARMMAIAWAAECGASVDQLRTLYDRVKDTDLREQILFAYVSMDDAAGTRELLRVARGNDATRLRKKAVFWLGQRASETVTREAGNATTAANEAQLTLAQLPQRPGEEAVPSLIEIARTSPSPQLRGRALLLLAQIGDPRAVDLFESIITKG
jgi:hypothetical protein